MGIFEKLFGSKKRSLSQTGHPDILVKTAEMPDEDLFWEIIAKSLKSSFQESQERYLIKEIGKLSTPEIIGFRLRTDKLLADTYNSAMWCAGYLINGGCSDDGFDYFRNWVISRGKEAYYSAKANPDSLISEASANTETCDFETFQYVADKAFKNKTGKELYDYIDYERFNRGEGKYPQFEFTWEEEKPESMKAICPRLFDKFFAE